MYTIMILKYKNGDDKSKVEIQSDIKCVTVIWNNKKTIVDSGSYEF